jgi:hypothetical protein
MWRSANIAILPDQILVVAPHEGLVPSDVWLSVRKKPMGNSMIGLGTSKKAKNTWLAWKIKCGRCGAGLSGMDSPTSVYKYFRCRKHSDMKNCEGCRLTTRLRKQTQKGNY